jgi:hypothetical protein
MRWIRRLVCFVGRHDWQTETDTAGSFTFCRRCGKVIRTGEYRHDPAQWDVDQTPL